ncbi:hypothetical protein ASC75_20275 [Aminobacter sp. DSM 101952]|nr:hypothetical protein ASC75_20275 [Aminobacter sp. DSM 101952]
MGAPHTLQRALTLGEALAATTLVKHNSWKYEREVRVTLIQRNTKPEPEEFLTQITSINPDDTYVRWRKPLIRQSRGRDVKYLDFEYGRFSNGRAVYARAIERVTCGPRCELTAQDIRTMLASEGFEGFQVVRSDCLVQ